MSGCAWSDAGKLLYSSAVSQQKFNCENDKVGTSIQRCKADIDKNINKNIFYFPINYITIYNFIPLLIQ